MHQKDKILLCIQITVLIAYEFELLKEEWWREQAGDGSWVAALYLPPPENVQLVLVLVLPALQIVQL